MTVTDLVYTKAGDWYGDPLPLNIEERIAKELYGDALHDSIEAKLIRDEKLDGEGVLTPLLFNGCSLPFDF